MAKTTCSGVLVLLFISNYILCTDAISPGDTARLHHIEMRRGNFSVFVTNYGASLTHVFVPDKNGIWADITLGYDLLQDYMTDDTYFGALVGRVANRIGGAQFKLDGEVYKLVPNEGKNQLHGGPKGFSDVIWDVEEIKEDSHVTFTYHSHDGEEGFPGELKVSVTYMLIETNKLGVKMVAEPVNKPTPVNLALHAYWNLGGHNNGDILNHTVQIFGSKITPVDKELIPTGEILPVEGTPYDFLTPHQINTRFNELPNGYDINYVLDDPSPGRHLKKAAMVKDHVSGRKMELWTSKPGVQFYTGNLLTSVRGKGNFYYKKHAALCLETQGFPDSVNHPNFPSQIVRPGQVYEHIMVYRFTA